MGDIAKIEKRILEIEVKIADGEVKVDQLRQKMDKLDQSTTSGAKAWKAYNMDLQNSIKMQTQLNSQLKKTQLEMAKAKASTRFLGQQMAYLASDAGFLLQSPRMGLMAIGNNLSQIMIQAQHTAKAVGGLGKAFRKAFIGNIWMIAIQLVVSVLTNWDALMAKIKGRLGEIDAATKGQIRTLGIYQAMLQKTNISETARMNIQSKLASMGVQLEGLDSRRADHLKMINQLIDLRKQHLTNQAKAELVNAKLQRKMQRMEKGRFLGFVDYLKIAWQAFKDFGKFMLGDWYDNFVGALQQAKKIFVGFTNAVYKGIKWLADKAGVDVSDWAENVIEFVEDTGDRLVQHWEDSFSETFKLIAQLKEQGKANLAKEIAELVAELENLTTQILDEKGVNAAAKLLNGLFGTPDSVNLQFMRRLDLIKAFYDSLDELDKQKVADGEMTQAEADQRKLDREKEYGTAVLKLKEDFAKQEIQAYGKKLQALNDLYGNMGGLAIAGVLMDQGVALFDVVKGTIARIKHIKNLPDPTGISQGVLIAKEVVDGALNSALVIGTAKKSIEAIKKAGGKQKGGGGGGGRPAFNIVGSSGTNQLQSALKEQTEEIREANKGGKVTLVTDELETKQESDKAALENSSLG